MLWVGSLERLDPLFLPDFSWGALFVCVFWGVLAHVWVGGFELPYVASEDAALHCSNDLLISIQTALQSNDLQNVVQVAALPMVLLI